MLVSAVAFVVSPIFLVAIPWHFRRIAHTGLVNTPGWHLGTSLRDVQAPVLFMTSAMISLILGWTFVAFGWPVAAVGLLAVSCFLLYHAGGSYRRILDKLWSPDGRATFDKDRFVKPSGDADSGSGGG